MPRHEMPETRKRTFADSVRGRVRRDERRNVIARKREWLEN